MNHRTLTMTNLLNLTHTTDIETCLSVQTSKLYSMGFRDPVRRSTLADANETPIGAYTRNWPSG